MGNGYRSNGIIYCKHTLFFKTKSFHLKKASFVPQFKIFSNALKLGASSFITQMSIVVISLVCNIMLAKYGSLSIYGQDIPISVISIETKVFTIVINIVVGIVLGGQPILGYNIGAGKMNRVRDTYRMILTATLAVGIVSTLVLKFVRRLSSIYLDPVTMHFILNMRSVPSVFFFHWSSLPV